MSNAILRSQFASFSGSSNDGFPNPFLDMASLAVPGTMRSALYWSEYVYSTMGTYRMAMERVISYFLTDLEMMDLSEDEKDKWEPFLDDTLDIITTCQNMLRDRACYGNAFASIIIPFKRFLGCPKCGAHFPLKEMYDNDNFQFQFTLPDFIATCPVCKSKGQNYRGPWKLDDKPDNEEKKIKVKIWNPHEIELLHDPYTHDVHHLWRIPEDYKRLVRQGNLFHLERVPKQVLEAIHKNYMFRFNDDAIFHMKEPTLGGVVNRGWGIPRIISNFRQIWYVQVLHRQIEAIALDYVIPFRLITPAMRPGNSNVGGSQGIDPLMMFNGGDFRGQVRSMIRQRRRDPASFQILPFPINYQMLGAEANQLVPRDLMDQGMETLLNDAGIPVDLYKGNLQLQTAPVALRLFESTWHHLVHDVNAFLQWAVQQIAQVMSWEVIDVNLKRVTIADNMEKQMMALQLMMSQQLSATSGLSAIGYKWDDEQKRLAEEARIQAEIQSRIQEEMEQAGFAQQIAKGQPPGAQPAGPGGAAPPGGAPPADPSMAGAMGTSMAGPVSQYLQSLSPSTPQTPEDMMAVADSIANQLLGLPEGQKDSELRKLKQSNSVLHSLVRARIDQIRRDVKSQAGNAAMGQMQQQGGNFMGG